MGLVPSHLHLLAMEQKKHPMKGDVLVIGQLAVYETLEDVRRVFHTHNITPNILPDGFDVKNKIPHCVGTPREKFTNVSAVLTMLGVKKVFVADISDYENADYLIDLNYPVDQKYYDKFDFILDSGTLEHLFDVPTALANLARMVKKGGRIIFINPCSNTINHGFYSFNPNLFFDFFAANDFSNFSCYLIEGSSFNVYKKSNIYRYNYRSSLDEYALSSKNMVEIYFCATKNANADLKEMKKPIQGMYLAYDWGKKNINKPALNQLTVLHKFKEKIDFYKRKLEFATRRFRPEFIDRFWKSKRRGYNLTYLGKF